MPSENKTTVQEFKIHTHNFYQLPNLLSTFRTAAVLYSFIPKDINEVVFR